MAWPTLTTDPIYGLECGSEDNAIKSESESGYVTSRARFTRARQFWRVTYPNMPDSDKVLLKAHSDEVGAHTIFTWVDPATSTSYEVRFEKPPTFVSVKNNLWSVSFTLVEV